MTVNIKSGLAKWLRSVGLPGLAVMVSSLASSAVLAQDGLIGFIKTVTPETSVLIDGKPLRAQAGMPLQAGFVVKTGPVGTLGMTLRDNTILSFGPNSEFVIDEYLYAPNKGALKLSATLFKGSMQYISGIIAKLKPDAVSVKFPGGVVGVRGTEFLLLVEDDKS